MKKSRAVSHFPHLQAMSRAAAGFVAQELTAAVRCRGYATMVLSGGSTPRQLYELLASQDYKAEIPWSKIFFFWSDERCVPPEHEDSNYRMAFEALLSRVPVDSGAIYRIPVELGGRESAGVYEVLLKNFFLQRYAASGGPAAIFDLALLGVGSDGHTASIFAGSPALAAKCWVASVAAPEGIYPQNRVTLTLTLLNKAASVLFLAAEGKKEIVYRIFEKAGDARAGEYPAAHIHAQKKVSVFIADRN